MDPYSEFELSKFTALLLGVSIYFWFGIASTTDITGSGDGSANNHMFMLGYDPNGGFFRIRSTDTDGSSTDADVVRILDGQLTVDGNSTFDDSAFDEYDDAMVLYRAFGLEHRTEVYEAGKRILRGNQQELIEMGVLRLYPDGFVGYNDQRMAALLAGGIYQTRFTLDALATRMKELEDQLA